MSLISEKNDLDSFLRSLKNPPENMEPKDNTKAFLKEIILYWLNNNEKVFHIIKEVLGEYTEELSKNEKIDNIMNENIKSIIQEKLNSPWVNDMIKDNLNKWFHEKLSKL